MSFRKARCIGWGIAGFLSLGIMLPTIWCPALVIVLLPLTVWATAKCIERSAKASDEKDPPPILRPSGAQAVQPRSTTCSLFSRIFSCCRSKSLHQVQPTSNTLIFRSVTLRSSFLSGAAEGTIMGQIPERVSRWSPSVGRSG